jgi:hypothetical protein
MAPKAARHNMESRSHFCSATNMSFASDEENRRHKRLVKRASKLDVADLLEIAAMKGLRPREVHDESPSAGEESGDEAEPAPTEADNDRGAVGMDVAVHPIAAEAQPAAIADVASAAQPSAGSSADGPRSSRG